MGRAGMETLARPELVKTWRRPPTVLIVEDDELLTATIVEALSAEGYAVETARTVREVLDLLRAGFAPEIALLDEHLPDGLGTEICRMLKERDPYIRCMVISGDDDAAGKAVSARADHWLRKPFTMERLVTTLRTY